MNRSQVLQFLVEAEAFLIYPKMRDGDQSNKWNSKKRKLLIDFFQDLDSNFPILF
ncbi:hypothetical protein SAMN03080598_03031 [Algoriphagus boritolerans DSM 17298 = JCM 18970]|uniref:Uncharacterized protein n=1 Tax=Algoriphagus boritolerans DSM 17298 = JCM 18970 TaxID=1120964 RepID=A0A1H5YJX4_9BACT|nr:hypothetical protein SAMN03080598_03031 [Algoriphagus boritolerans DSM 17298 = JCM 18970]